MYDVSTVAKKVMPSIVSITGTYVTTYDYWFNSYQQESTGAGSGIIIGKDDQYLYLATNYHVVQNAKSLSVTFVDDKSADAVVKGYVENNDIAVVTVKLSDISDDTLNEIKEIQVGSSDDLAVGDPCVAIGNALGYGQSEIQLSLPFHPYKVFCTLLCKPFFFIFPNLTLYLSVLFIMHHLKYICKQIYNPQAFTAELDRIPDEYEDFRYNAGRLQF